MAELKLRHELKHFVTAHDCHIIRGRIRHVMQRDPNSREDGTYHIRSLYFDNAENKILNEKLLGVDNRDKWRIRIYNLNDRHIRLEKKSKLGTMTSKTSISLHRYECEALLHYDFAWLRDSEHKLLRELYVRMSTIGLKPRSIIDYKREAFIYDPGNVRVTFDSGVRCGLDHTNIFNRNTPTIATLNPGLIILEVKYDEYLPEFISNLLQLGNRERLSVSKYALGRIYG